MSLAIEGGATTSSILYIGEKSVLKFKIGPGNFKILNEHELDGFFRSIKIRLGERTLKEVGVGMPGIVTDEDQKVVLATLRKVWPEVSPTSFWVGSDVETAIACLNSGSKIKVIVIAGTGSNCYGTDGAVSAKIGGGGHILGDRGSSYLIALKALRFAYREFETGNNSPLLTALIKSLSLSTPQDLVTWSTTASKTELAQLAEAVIQLSRQGNQIAVKVVDKSLKELSEDCFSLLKKLTKIGDSFPSIEVGLTGSLFTKNDDFATSFKKLLADKAAISKFTLLNETVQGALAYLNNNNLNNNNSVINISQLPVEIEDDGKKDNETEEALAEKILPTYLSLPTTECRNKNSTYLSTMSLSEAIDLFISEESNIYSEIRKEAQNLENLVGKVSSSLKSGGRLFYVGAGTSGRLGVLDAAECPPTFRTNPEIVQGILAGGAWFRAKEGAEDSIKDGINAIRERFVNEKDVVLGIAASGRTPFVWGAMKEAHTLGAFTAFLTFNTKLSMKFKPDIILAMDLGPEILTGSTRLKSGSATKCVLNMISTLSMVQLGKCFENLMVDLNPSNNKLKQRSLRIVLLLVNNSEITEEIAKPLLIKNAYNIKQTVLELRQLFSRVY